ncbi:MAG: tRNA modification GTPase MnmE [Chlamydiia bacterium]|nr:tRNA modification GTPase MnmE [Chlamydiia bacterium]MCH9616258.1 tRNA modification GTPase MnmE [Chlamydiia bacterium]MCH9629756.1 tRNA modification GTPase MnmE [Chlamydiia bacterium]
MEFVHRTYERGQTIAAIATPPGEGGVAIIRISGDNALDVADRIFSGPVKKFATHTVHFGQILDIDEGLAIPMLGEKSYTGEDTVEIHCHGGSLIARQVLEAALNAGARAALPGEFTFKAFQNGRIDLTQAEAVQSLIAAKNTLAASSSKHQLEGKLRERIESFQKRLFEIAAILEAWVDFPEEGLEFASFEEVTRTLKGLIEEMETLQATYHDGKRLHAGFTLVLLGKPNVGKSSLLNALTGKERAIVTEIPGTTRDLIEEEIIIDNLHFRLVDTAGIRETEEVVEKEGVRRSKQAAEEADLVLHVHDVREYVQSEPAKNTLVILNKADLQTSDHEGILVSAKTGEGMLALKAAIHAKVWKDGPPSKEEVTLTNHRHFQALANATEAVSSVKTGLETDVSPEFLNVDMRDALRELGTIIGTNITEDILSSIFSKFCVGK